MASTNYQVLLSTDGKHTVIVSSDDQGEFQAAVGWAKQTYDDLVERYGLKHQQYQRSGSPSGAETGDQIPICAVHDLPMVKVRGSKGPFWSCRQKDDGQWCSYRPPKQG